MLLAKTLIVAAALGAVSLANPATAAAPGTRVDPHASRTVVAEAPRTGAHWLTSDVNPRRTPAHDRGAVRLGTVDVGR
jgi:hypothetical protein